MARRAAQRVVALGSSMLDVATLRGCSLGGARIEVTEEALERVRVGREVVDRIVAKGDTACVCAAAVFAWRALLRSQ